MKKYILIFSVIILLIINTGKINANPKNISERSLNQKQVLVVMYHHIHPENTDIYRNFPYLTVSPERFEEDIKLFKQLGFRFLTTDEYYNYITGKLFLDRPSVLITFDDGCDCNYYYALSILKKYNVKATLFLIVGRDRSDKTFNPNVSQSLSWKQLKEMKDSGVFDIQSHTFDMHFGNFPHENEKNKSIFQRPSEDYDTYKKRIYNDLVLSKEILEKQLGERVYYLAWPLGKYNETSIEAAVKAGYKLQFTTDKGINKPGEPLPLVKRINAGSSKVNLLKELIKYDFLFKDTKDLKKHKDIIFLRTAGIINGLGNNYFESYNNMTRAQLAAVIARAKNLPGAEPTFKDVPSNHWAYKFIGAVEKAGIMKGYGNNFFKPDSNVTRGEALLTISSAFDNDRDIITNMESDSLKLIANKKSLKNEVKITRGEVAEIIARKIKPLMW